MCLLLTVPLLDRSVQSLARRPDLQDWQLSVPKPWPWLSPGYDWVKKEKTLNQTWIDHL